MAEISQKDIGLVVKSYPRERRYSLAILQDVERKFGYIPKEAIEVTAEHLNVKAAVLYAMATFYRALSLKPKGKHTIKVCDGTACHIRGSNVLLSALEQTLGIKPGETTKDGLFSIETVNCLGACAIAPVMVVDKQYYSKVKPAEVGEILSQYGKPDGEAKNG